MLPHPIPYTRKYFDELAAIFNRARPNGMSRVLFNYTRCGFLKYLISPGADITCAHSMWQNDPAEIMLGLWLFMRFLQKHAGYSDVHAGTLMRHLFVQLEKSRESASAAAAPYIFCFTDNEDYLYFWNEYMKDCDGDASAGGYAVGFWKGAIEAAIKQINSSSKDHLLFLFPCLYAGRDDENIEAFFSAVYKYHRDEFEAYRRETNPVGHPSTRVMSMMLVTASIVKGAQWSCENEWRLLLFPRLGEQPDRTSGKPRIKSGILKLCQPDLADILKCIWFSPQGDRAKQMEEVRECLDSIGSTMTGAEQMAPERKFFMFSKCWRNRVGDYSVEVSHLPYCR